MLAGPYCGLLLADLGAEVIKIEPPTGDISRHVGPHRIGPHNAYFAAMNRDKKSVVIDLAAPAGQRQLAALARTAQALVTNLRPTAIRKLGLTYDVLRAVNPRLVCVALTGFGLDSPYAERPAYDYVIQAMTGIMEMTGDPAGPPTKAGYSAVDNSAGIMAALGLLAKIVEGKGGQVDVAMFDVMLSQLNYVAGASLNAGEKAQRFAASAHPWIVPAQVFAARDGWLAARSANRGLVVGALGEVFATADVAAWLARLVPLGIVVSAVNTLEQALAGEQTRARRMVIDVPYAGGVIRGVGNPIKTGDDGAHTPPPLLGEHNYLLTADVAS
jgi:CoA:oxalate CoA-transferase